MIRENPWTSFMLIFVAVLYSIIFVTGREAGLRKAATLNKGPVAVQGKSLKYTPAELKEKEERFKKNIAEHPKVMTGLAFGFLVVMGCGVLLDISFIQAARRRKSWRGDSPSSTMVSWGMKEVFQAALFLFFIEGCLFIVQAAGHGLTGIRFPQDWATLVFSFIRDLSVTLFILGLIIRKNDRPFSALGFNRGHIFSSIGTGLKAYVAVLPLLAISFMLITAVSHLFSYEPAPQNVVEMYLQQDSKPYLYFFTLFVAGFGPVIEEIFFRGFAYPALRKSVGARWAAAAVAAVFAAIHMNVAAFFPIFLLGLFLCYLVESTGSLIPSIAAHVTHNTVMVLLTLGFKTFSA